jgi:predicted TIM-barrel fold metal-dependent hydrolase
VVWGSDYPALSEVTTQKEIEHLHLPAATKRAIERENVLRLLPHLRTRLAREFQQTDSR